MKENFVLINGNGLENGRMLRRALDPSESKDKAKILQQWLRTRALKLAYSDMHFGFIVYLM